MSEATQEKISRARKALEEKRKAFKTAGQAMAQARKDLADAIDQDTRERFVAHQKAVREAKRKAAEEKARKAKAPVVEEKESSK